MAEGGGNLAQLLVGAFVATTMAVGVGINAAVQVAPPVGAGALSLSSALIMGSVFEFIGGMAVSPFVSATIRKGIVDLDAFASFPSVFARGMLSALFGASVWLFLATYWALPVSTTHAIVGGLVGFALVARGADSLNWGGIGNISISWVTSPLSGFLVAWAMFVLCQRTILCHGRAGAREAAFKWAPFHISVTVLIMTVFSIESGLKALKLSFPFWLTLVMGTAVGILAYLITMVKVVPLYRKRGQSLHNIKKRKSDQGAPEKQEPAAASGGADERRSSVPSDHEALDHGEELDVVEIASLVDDTDGHPYAVRRLSSTSSDVPPANYVVHLVSPTKDEIEAVSVMQSADPHASVETSSVSTESVASSVVPYDAIWAVHGAKKHGITVHQMLQRFDEDSDSDSATGVVAIDTSALEARLGTHATGPGDENTIQRLERQRRTSVDPFDVRDTGVGSARAALPRGKGEEAPQGKRREDRRTARTAKAEKRAKRKRKEKEQRDEALKDFQEEITTLGRHSAVPLFFFMQTLAAAFVALGHGANDLANATGPFSAILAVYETGTVGQAFEMPVWIYAIAAIILDFGLLVFGRGMLKTVSEKITLLTPVGGYVAQLSTSLTTIVCSRIGMPISTTHILIGAILGVGIARSGRKSLNFRLIGKIVLSWLVTLPVSAASAIVLYWIMDLVGF